jgi:hypothetical protein
MPTTQRWVRVYRVQAASGAPRLAVRDPDQFGRDFLVFDGSPKTPHSSAAPFQVIEEHCANPRQFYHLAPGVLVGDGDAMFECAEMYHATSGNERLAMQGEHKSFMAINPLDFAPPATRPGPPCAVDRFYASLFRLRSAPAVELFCVTGFEVPMDEFKNVYDSFGFSGLEFELIWEGEQG